MQNRIVTMLMSVLFLCGTAKALADTEGVQQLSGIGAGLKLSEGGVLLEEIFQGSPAEGAGLRDGEKILEVDGRSIVGLSIEEVVQRITGPAGSVVRLRVASLEGATRDVFVIRAKIDLSAKGPEAFLGSYRFADEEDKKVHITHVQEDVYRAECPQENWTATGIIYQNRSFKSFHFKGYYQMHKSPAVHANMQGVAGFVRIDYQRPGRLHLMRAWNLEGGSGSDPSSVILIREQEMSQTQASIGVVEFAQGNILQQKIKGKDKSFGLSGALSGNTLVIGAQFEPNEKGNSPGSVYVYGRSKESWIQQAKLTAERPNRNEEHFGFSVACSEDLVVVGATYDDPTRIHNPSRAYVYGRAGGAWVLEGILKASAAKGRADFFGGATAVDGNTVVVGASWAEAAHVFTRSEGSWEHQTKLTAGDGVPRGFGHSVSISGDTIVVGASLDDDPKKDAGSAYVFTRTGAAWTQQARLTARQPCERARFGGAVSVGKDTIAVGAQYNQVNGRKDGAAFVFNRSGNTWIQQAKLIAKDYSQYANFGCAVSVSGDRVAVGAKGDREWSGAVYVFERTGGSWQEQKYTAADGAPKEQFGGWVSLTSSTLAVGAQDVDNQPIGAVVYLLSPFGAQKTE